MTFLRIFVILGVFATSVFLFSQIPWVETFHIQKPRNYLEEKLGAILWSFLQATEVEEYAEDKIETLNKILIRICEANQIDRKKIKLHIIQKDEINAFVIPDDYLIVYTGLLTNAENAGEIAGILAHEIAHIELKHVMDKMTKEIGLSILLRLITGQDSSTLKTVLAQVTSFAFSRELEAQADEAAVDYLITAKINPAHLIDFFARQITKTDSLDWEKWSKTHPNIEDRIEAILKKIGNNPPIDAQILTPEEFKRLQQH